MMAGYLEDVGDLISPPLLLTVYAFLLLGVLFSAHWLLSRQLHRIEQARTGIGATTGMVGRWPDHTLLFLSALAAIAVAIAGYGLARWRRMREAGQLQGPMQIRSLLAREGLGVLTLVGVLAWFAAGVQAQDRLADHWLAAARQAAALTAPDPSASEDADGGAGLVPGARARVIAADRRGESAYNSAMATLARLKRQGHPITQSVILPALAQIRQAESVIERSAMTASPARAEALKDLRGLEVERRRLVALSHPA
jgi:hypothetical protein